MGGEVGGEWIHAYAHKVALLFTETFMDQGKLEVVKEEMERVNVDILGISKLKWTGMGPVALRY